MLRSKPSEVGGAGRQVPFYLMFSTLHITPDIARWDMECVQLGLGRWSGPEIFGHGRTVCVAWRISITLSRNGRKAL